MQEFLAHTQPRTVALALIAIVSLLVLAQFTYLLWPQIGSFRELYAQYTLLEQAVSNNSDVGERLQESEVEVNELSRQLHGDMAQLPVKQVESFVIGRLQKVSWSTDVVLVSVQPGSGGQVQNFREQLFEVKLNAHYHDFFKWLQIVNEELGYIVVKNFDISPSDRSLENPRLNFSLTLVSYRIEANHVS